MIFCSTFCLIDKDQTVFSVTLYNVSPSFSVKTGDAVAIAEPFLQLVDVEYEDKVRLKYINQHLRYINPSDAEAIFVQSTQMQRFSKTNLSLSCWHSLDSSLSTIR